MIRPELSLHSVVFGRTYKKVEHLRKQRNLFSEQTCTRYSRYSDVWQLYYFTCHTGCRFCWRMCRDEIWRRKSAGAVVYYRALSTGSSPCGCLLPSRTTGEHLSAASPSVKGLARMFSLLINSVSTDKEPNCSTDIPGYSLPAYTQRRGLY